MADGDVDVQEGSQDAKQNLERALVSFNLAPLSSRRDMAMLGLIHRSALGDGPPQFQQFFQPAAPPPHTHHTRYQARARHRRQLADPIDGTHTEYLKRSVFGLIKVYNDLPPEIADCTTVQAFQAGLQQRLRGLAAQEMFRWELAFRRA